uniref:Serine/threonine-protein phosphatase 2A activator n=1 Tax=Echinococcus canadensis TaxID=519352 RepID=A0A915F0M0_9CEST
MVLSKRIQTQSDLGAWTASVAYANIINFIEGVNYAVRAKLINDRQTISPNTSKVIGLLDHLDAQVALTPLEVNPQRYGNKAFQKYYSWLCENASQICAEKLGIEPSTENFDEVTMYLTESIGNPVRIDYGTGHELSFMAFLLSLFKIGYLKQIGHSGRGLQSGSSAELNDYAATALYILPAYLRLVRHLQTYFRMEPAGSHGVWSLDDFQFVPYIWGSSQLIGTGLYEPSALPDQEIAEKEANSCLLFSCINYIYQVKTGPFAEHSSCLQSLSGVPNWEKVNSGMIKMYKGEVLNKFPVVQHFLFGNLLKFEPAQPTSLNAGPPGRFRFPGTSSFGHSSGTPPRLFFVKPTGDP